RAEMKGPHQYVVRSRAQLEVFDRRSLLDIVPADQKYPSRRKAAGNDVIDDRLPPAFGNGTENAGAVVAIGRRQPFQPRAGKGRTEAVAYQDLLDLHLGAIGK